MTLLAGCTLIAVLAVAGHRFGVALPGRGRAAARRLNRLGFAPAPRRRRRHAAAPARSPEAPEELALLLDLIAAGLAAGAPLSTALDAADLAVPPPRRHPLTLARAAAATGSLDALDPAGSGLPAPLVRALRRSGRSGSRLADQLRLLADDLRGEAAGAALDRARRVGVLAVLPLGLCCLPAFVLLAVVPLGAGLLSASH